ncbi:MAG: hypothetical protein AAB733_04470 [Patescibacteria group bacterium]
MITRVYLYFFSTLLFIVPRMSRAAASRAFDFGTWAKKLDVPRVAEGEDQVGATAQVIINATNAALTFIGLLAMIGLIIAGFLYLTAGGNKERVDTAKGMIRNVIVGIALILLAFVVTNFVIGFIAQSLGAFDEPPE